VGGFGSETPNLNLIKSGCGTQQKNVYRSLPFQCQKQHCFPESWPVFFDFSLLVFHLMLDLDPNPVPEPDPKCILVPVPLRQKVAVPTVPVSVPQYL
jgi:hypothetical protein